MNKKRSFLAILLVFVMCFALVLSGCNRASESGKPDEDKPGKENSTTSSPVIDSIDKTLGALLGQDSVTDVIGQAFEGGKVTVEIDGVLQNVLYMDAKGGYFADVLKIQNQGQTIDLSLYLDGGELAVTFPVLLGDQAYGIDFSTLVQDLKNSEIWSLLGTSFEDVQNQLGIDIGQMMDAFEGIMDATDDMGDVFADALKGIETTQEEGTVTINGTEVKAINIKYHVTSQDIYGLFEAYMNESEKLMKDMMSSMAGAMGVDPEQILGRLNMDEVRQEMKKVFDEMNIQGDLVISISPDTQYIMCVAADVSGTMEDETISVDMDLVLGTDPANSDKYTFSMVMNVDEEINGINAEIVRTTNGSVETSTIKVNSFDDEESMEVMSGYLSYDNSNGAYELSLNSDGDIMAFTGKFQQTDDKLDFTLDTMTMDDETQKIGMRVCVESINPSEMPKMPSYKNILRMSKEELNALLDGFMDGMTGEELGEILGGLLGGDMEDILGDKNVEDLLDDEFMSGLINGNF